jgi:hypothetical protein
VHTFPSSWQGEPGGSYSQLLLQQSPSIELPSSHSSPTSTIPFGHAGVGVGVIVAVGVEVPVGVEVGVCVEVAVVVLVGVEVNVAVGV